MKWLLPAACSVLRPSPIPYAFSSRAIFLKCKLDYAILLLKTLRYFLIILRFKNKLLNIGRKALSGLSHLPFQHSLMPFLLLEHHWLFSPSQLTSSLPPMLGLCTLYLLSSSPGNSSVSLSYNKLLLFLQIPA